MTPSDIKAYRVARGLSQRQLGEVLGVTRLTVARWETGERGISPIVERAIRSLPMTANWKMGGKS